MAVTPPYGGLIRYFTLASSAVILVGCAIHIALQIFWVLYVLVLNVDASRFFLIP